MVRRTVYDLVARYSFVSFTGHGVADDYFVRFLFDGEGDCGLCRIFL